MIFYFVSDKFDLFLNELHNHLFDFAWDLVLGLESWVFDTHWAKLMRCSSLCKEELVSRYGDSIADLFFFFFFKTLKHILTKQNTHQIFFSLTLSLSFPFPSSPWLALAWSTKGPPKLTWLAVTWSGEGEEGMKEKEGKKNKTDFRFGVFF